jgi:hypothetical protein
MKFDYDNKGKVIISMIEELPDDISGTVATPATFYLLNVDPNPPILKASTAEMFHTLVTKL